MFEIGQVGSAFNTMQQKFGQIMEQVAGVAASNSQSVNHQRSDTEVAAETFKQWHPNLKFKLAYL